MLTSAGPVALDQWRPAAATLAAASGWCPVATRRLGPLLLPGSTRYWTQRGLQAQPPAVGAGEFDGGAARTVPAAPPQVGLAGTQGGVESARRRQSGAGGDLSRPARPQSARPAISARASVTPSRRPFRRVPARSRTFRPDPAGRRRSPPAKSSATSPPGVLAGRPWTCVRPTTAARGATEPGCSRSAVGSSTSPAGPRPYAAAGRWGRPP